MKGNIARLFNLSLALLENLIFCGFVFGWGTMTFVLKKENIYGNLCDNNSSNDVESNRTLIKSEKCDAQDGHLVMCHTIASSAMYLMSVVIGYLNYKLDIKLVRILTYVMFTTGCVCFAFVKQDRPWLIYPGWTLIGVGGFGTFITNLRVVMYFPKRYAIAMSLLNGTVSSSVLTSLLVKVARDHGFSLENIFFCIAGLHVAALIRTCFFMQLVDMEPNIVKNTERTIVSSKCKSHQEHPRMPSANASPANARTTKEKQVYVNAGYSDDKTSNLGDKTSDLLHSKTTYNICSNVDQKTLCCDKDSNGDLLTSPTKMTTMASDGDQETNPRKNKTLVSDDDKFICKFDNATTDVQDAHLTLARENSIYCLNCDNITSADDKTTKSTGDSITIDRANQSSESRGNTTTNSTDNKMLTLKDCLRHPFMFFHTFWFTILGLRVMLYLGTFNQHFNTVFERNVDEVSQMTDVLNYLLIAGLVVSYLSGIFYAWQAVFVRDFVDERHRRVKAAVVPLALTSLLGVTLSFVTLFKHKAFAYIAFVILPVYRAFLYGTNGIFIYSVFPSEYAGVIFGTATFFMGLFNLLQYGFYSWSDAYNEANMHVNICLLCLTCLTLIHPAYLWWSAKRIPVGIASKETTNAKSTHV